MASQFQHGTANRTNPYRREMHELTHPVNSQMEADLRARELAEQLKQVMTTNGYVYFMTSVWEAYRKETGQSYPTAEYRAQAIEAKLDELAALDDEDYSATIAELRSGQF